MRPTDSDVFYVGTESFHSGTICTSCNFVVLSFLFKHFVRSNSFDFIWVDMGTSGNSLGDKWEKC